MITGTPTTYWVCLDCFYAAEGLTDWAAPSEPDREPLGLIPQGATITAGLLREEHDDGCVEGEECGCEHVEFSWLPCAGCGSNLGGSREALTVWSS